MGRAILMVLVWVAIVACNNEPFQELSLKVTSFQNIEGKSLKTYQYKNTLLYQFKATDQKNNKTTLSSKFIFDGEFLDRIISDSTYDTKSFSYKLTEIYYQGSLPIGDTTFLITSSGKTRVSVHTFQFDSENNLINFTTTAFKDNVSDSVITVDLAREAGNVVKLSRYRVDGETRTLRRELTLGYEDHKAVIPSRQFEYFYTLDLDEGFLLSTNNPTVIKEKGKKDVVCVYNYNRFDHPAYFKRGSTQFNVSYTSF